MQFANVLVDVNTALSATGYAFRVYYLDSLEGCAFASSPGGATKGSWFSTLENNCNVIMAKNFAAIYPNKTALFEKFILTKQSFYSLEF